MSGTAVCGPIRGWRLRAAVALVLTVATLGCIYVSDTFLERPMPAPDESVLSAVKEGVTTREWVVATLGEPHYRGTADGCELLGYEYVWRERTSRRILFVWRSGGQTTHTLRLTFQIKDGLVVRYREERAP
jgi:outer membrane protein assembly factor BamE (lipoprotein component of BamABCDE complex)